MITYLEAAFLVVGPALLIIGVGSIMEMFWDWKDNGRIVARHRREKDA